MNVRLLLMGFAAQVAYTRSQVDRYFLGQNRNVVCTEGESIDSKSECEVALQSLGQDVLENAIEDGQLCYINGNGKGRADGNHANWGSFQLVCKKAPAPTPTPTFPTDQPTPAPTPAPAPTPYTLSSDNSNECPSDFSHIAAGQCETAADALGGTFKGTFDYDNRPAGCYWKMSNGFVYANLNSVGLEQEGFQTVCGKVDQYFLGESKEDFCIEGIEIKSKYECEVALESLGMDPIRNNVEDDQSCYINGNGKGRADGNHANWAKFQFICKKDTSTPAPTEDPTAPTPTTVPTPAPTTLPTPVPSLHLDDPPTPAPTAEQKTDWCESSPAQTCRMLCSTPACPSGQCAMRQGDCCDHTCVAPIKTEWCANSPTQTCRMRCSEPACPSGQCAMRQGTCCDHTCEVSSDEHDAWAGDYGAYGTFGEYGENAGYGDYGGYAGYGEEREDECACHQVWEFKGKEYLGCAQPEASEDSWCYVDGDCAKAEDSEYRPDAPWRSCTLEKDDVCQCFPEWTYEEVIYNGCAKTPDSKEPWCYVDRRCDHAEDSEKYIGAKFSRRPCVGPPTPLPTSEPTASPTPTPAPTPAPTVPTPSPTVPTPAPSAPTPAPTAPTPMPTTPTSSPTAPTPAPTATPSPTEAPTPEPPTPVQTPSPTEAPTPEPPTPVPPTPAPLPTPWPPTPIPPPESWLTPEPPPPPELPPAPPTQAQPTPHPPTPAPTEEKIVEPEVQTEITIQNLEYDKLQENKRLLHETRQAIKKPIKKRLNIRSKNIDVEFSPGSVKADITIKSAKAKSTDSSKNFEIDLFQAQEVLNNASKEIELEINDEVSQVENISEATVGNITVFFAKLAEIVTAAPTPVPTPEPPTPVPTTLAPTSAPPVPTPIPTRQPTKSPTTSPTPPPTSADDPTEGEGEGQDDKVLPTPTPPSTTTAVPPSPTPTPTAEPPTQQPTVSPTPPLTSRTTEITESEEQDGSRQCIGVIFSSVLALVTSTMFSVTP